MTSQHPPHDGGYPVNAPGASGSPAPPPPMASQPPAQPQSAQEWIDRATSQGVPGDYAPPIPPGAPVDPRGSGQAHAEPGQASHAGPAQPNVQQQPLPQQQAPQQHPQHPQQSAPPQQQPLDAVLGGGGRKRRVVDTSSDKSDGLDRCPKCGSTEVSLRPGTGMLICHFCRNEWSEGALEQKFGFDSPIDELQGTLLGSGASNQPESTEMVVTLKCGACGAEVVVNTAEALQSRCHWCRNTLSINQQLPNGAVPDGLLPFSVTKDDAIARIDEFVKKRKFFAHPKFVREFAPSEVVGVYLPYLTVDANVSVELEGKGEIKTGQRTIKQGDNTKTVYDADIYRLGRAFDMSVDDILLESSQQRADQDTSRNTNNIINTILPFDVKNAVTYNANYLRGFTSERRDLHVDQLMPAADEQTLSIARSRANESTRRYDRGIRWEREHLVVHGTRWLSLYVPVWLYSYYQERNGVGLVHYVAVNGRTGETMGSVPVRQGRLLAFSIAIGVVGTVVGGALAFMMLVGG